MALGADRSGIVRLFVFESTLVSLIAAAIGLALAVWTVGLVPRIAGQNIPLESQTSLAFAGAAFHSRPFHADRTADGTLSGVAKFKADLVDGLKDGGRAVSGSRGQHRFRRGLVAAQVGLSVVLLAAAAMLVSSFVRLSKQESGFRTERVWTGGIGLPPAQYPDSPTRARFMERLVSEIQTSPGVEAVALPMPFPFPGIRPHLLMRASMETRCRSIKGPWGLLAAFRPDISGPWEYRCCPVVISPNETGSISPWWLS